VYGRSKSGNWGTEKDILGNILKALNEELLKAIDVRAVSRDRREDQPDSPWDCFYKFNPTVVYDLFGVQSQCLL